MAKHRKRSVARRIRASPRRAFFRAKKRRSSRSSGGSVKPIQMEAIGYGMIRKFASGLLAPITSMLPIGEFADEVTIGAVDYFVAKNTGGMIKKVAMAGLTFENVMLGSDISNKFLGGAIGTSNNNNLFSGGY